MFQDLFIRLLRHESGISPPPFFETPLGVPAARRVDSVVPLLPQLWRDGAKSWRSSGKNILKSIINVKVAVVAVVVVRVVDGAIE